MTLDKLNKLNSAQAKHFFMQCCTSSKWVERMVKALPYSDELALKEAANKAWQDLDKRDYLEAFEGHPKIGDLSSLRAKYANTKALAGNEQGLVKEADEQILNALSQGNKDYEDKFGFIFIVCATGKSAEEMSQLLQTRLPNTYEQELTNAAQEQRKIFQIRIDKALAASE